MSTSEEMKMFLSEKFSHLCLSEGRGGRKEKAALGSPNRTGFTMRQIRLGILLALSKLFNFSDPFYFLDMYNWDKTSQLLSYCEDKIRLHV